MVNWQLLIMIHLVLWSKTILHIVTICCEPNARPCTPSDTTELQFKIWILKDFLLSLWTGCKPLLTKRGYCTIQFSLMALIDVRRRPLSMSNLISVLFSFCHNYALKHCIIFLKIWCFNKYFWLHNWKVFVHFDEKW